MIKEKIKFFTKNLLYRNEDFADDFFYNYNLFKNIYKVKFSDKNYQNELEKKINDSNSPNVYLIGTPEHNNIGDAAIAYAEIKFIENNFSSYNFIEVVETKVLDSISVLQKYITNQDLVFYHGGGNMGTIYVSQELARQTFVKAFSSQKIFSFPQSIIFENNKISEKLKKRLIKTYSETDNFILCAREQVSLDIMSNLFPNKKIIFCPDIVFSLNIYDKLNINRDHTVITLLRNDDEHNRTQHFDLLVQNLFQKNYNRIVKSDTTYKNEEDKIQIKNREKILLDKWNELTNSELVLTDRLHGMIFSYITQTPCLVISNKNHKIISSINTWLADCNFIKIIDINFSSEEVKKEIEDLKSIHPTPVNLKPYFQDYLTQIEEIKNE